MCIPSFSYTNRSYSDVLHSIFFTSYDVRWIIVQVLHLQYNIRYRTPWRLDAWHWIHSFEYPQLAENLYAIFLHILTVFSTPMSNVVHKIFIFQANLMRELEIWGITFTFTQKYWFSFRSSCFAFWLIFMSFRMKFKTTFIWFIKCYAGDHCISILTLFESFNHFLIISNKCAKTRFLLPYKLNVR